MTAFRIAAALSTEPDTLRAAQDVARRVASELGGPADLAVAFFSPHHREQADRLAVTICDALQTEKLVGSTGEAIVGPRVEVEGEPALVLWGARLPGVEPR